MLKARLFLSDVDAPVSLADGGILLGNSEIWPLRHRAIDSQVITDTVRTAVIVSERMAGAQAVECDHADRVSHTEYDHIIGELDPFPLDYCCLEIDGRRRSVSLRSSKWGSAPVYGSSRNGALHLSWNIADLLNGHPASLSARVLATYLSRNMSYSARTIVDDVLRLTADSVMEFDGSGLRVVYPPARNLDCPTPIANGVNLEDRFFRAVEAQIGIRDVSADRVVAEVSGGMDSSISALAVGSALGKGVLSLGGILAGKMGVAQKARRAMVVETAGLDDAQLPAYRYRPYDTRGARRRDPGVWPEDANYPELFEALYSAARQSGVDCIVTGMGGDELYPLYRGEDPKFDEHWDRGRVLPSPFGTELAWSLEGMDRADRYPPAELRNSCWVGAAGRASQMLQHGLWPIYPFHSVRIARFTYKLPLEHREDRTLHRRVLTKKLGNGVFETKYEKETFVQVVNAGLNENRDFVHDLIRDGHCVRLGFVDFRAVEKSLNKDANDMSTPEKDGMFFLANFEAFFQGCDVSANFGASPVLVQRQGGRVR